MPLLAGGSVADALKEDYRFSIAQAITIAMDALDALAYLRREFNALHRDTKPGNVLLDKDRTRGYLSDFGSAGSDADVYGIGMMLYEMLNGRIAWETLDLEQLERRLQRGLRAVSDSSLEFAPHIPDRLRRCVRKAIHRDPAQRYASPEAFITALRKVRCITGFMRTAPGWWARGSDLATPPRAGPPHRVPGDDTRAGGGPKSRSPPRGVRLSEAPRGVASGGCRRHGGAIRARGSRRCIRGSRGKRRPALASPLKQRHGTRVAPHQRPATFDELGIVHHECRAKPRSFLANEAAMDQ